MFTVLRSRSRTSNRYTVNAVNDADKSTSVHMEASRFPDRNGVDHRNLCEPEVFGARAFLSGFR
jgi:hypothetical protein